MRLNLRPVGTGKVDTTRATCYCKNAYEWYKNLARKNCIPKICVSQHHWEKKSRQNLGG